MAYILSTYREAEDAADASAQRSGVPQIVVEDFGADCFIVMAAKAEDAYLAKHDAEVQYRTGPWQEG